MTLFVSGHVLGGCQNLVRFGLYDSMLSVPCINGRKDDEEVDK